MILGLFILAIGLWYVADRTLGLDLPRLNWDQLWPLALVGLGTWIIAGPRLRGR